MRKLMRILIIAIAIPGALAVGGFGSFFVMLWWDANVIQDHDGQAGIGYLIIAFFIGVACALAAAVAVARSEWKRDHEKSPSSRSGT